MFFDIMHISLSILERVNFLSNVLGAHLSHVGTRGGEDAAWRAYVMWKYVERKPFFSHPPDCGCHIEPAEPHTLPIPASTLSNGTRSPLP